MNRDTNIYGLSPQDARRLEQALRRLSGDGAIQVPGFTFPIRLVKPTSATEETTDIYPAKIYGRAVTGTGTPALVEVADCWLWDVNSVGSISTSIYYPCLAQLGWDNGDPDFRPLMAYLGTSVSGKVAIVRKTSSTADANGYYPGKIQSWNPGTLAWSDGDDCRILDAN